MGRRKSRTLTELELEIMQALWNREEATVEDLANAFKEAGKRLAEPSFRTMLRILRGKGYVSRRRAGRGYVYRAIIPSQQAHRNILRDIISRVFDGSAANLVAALLSEGMVSESELAEAKRLIEKREKGGRK